jgi:hypothetical protein
MVRKKDGTRIGHASIIDQLGWCNKAGIPRAIFTHCGSPIVRADPRKMNVALQQLGRDHGVEACFACDGIGCCLSTDASCDGQEDVLEPAENHRSLAFNLPAAERLLGSSDIAGTSG